jgi:hypothetical protein
MSLPVLDCARLLRCTECGASASAETFMLAVQTWLELSDAVRWSLVADEVSPALAHGTGRGDLAGTGTGDDVV